MKQIVYLLVFVFVCFFIQSCKEEGCIDPDALNYNAIADEDDGSCIYCSDPQIDTLFMRVDSLIETRFGSSLFGEPVFLLDLLQTKNSGAILNCPDSEPTCTTEFTLTNISEFEMVSFDIDININGPQIFNSFFLQDLNLQAGQDTVIAVQETVLTFTNCPVYENSTTNHGIFSGIYVN